MPSTIQIDWFVIRITNIRRVIALVVTGVIAAGLVFIAYQRLNLPPEGRARKAIEAAEAAKSEAEKQILTQGLRRELSQATTQLEAARENYLEELWPEAESNAETARLRFLALAGSGAHQLSGAGEFFSLEGRVQLQRAGLSEWDSAQQRMPVFSGDFVRTGRDGSAEILFRDGSLYRIAPNSLLEIQQEAELESSTGAVKMRVGRIDVTTSGSPSTVTTDTAATEISSDSRVAVDVDEGEDSLTRIAAYEGGAHVVATGGEEITLSSKQQVEASAEGGLSSIKEIPDPPLLLEPPNNTSIDMKKQKVLTLKWRRQSESQSVHLQVSKSRLFVPDAIEVENTTIRSDSARLKAVAPGTYFWRASLINASGVESEWSQTRRIRVYSSLHRTVLTDQTPPQLQLLPTQQLGAMFIVQGQTEAGAAVTVNGENVVTDIDGHFRKTIEIPNEGWNHIEVVVTDLAGNETKRAERVFVEVY